MRGHDECVIHVCCLLMGGVISVSCLVGTQVGLPPHSDLCQWLVGDGLWFNRIFTRSSCVLNEIPRFCSSSLSAQNGAWYTRCIHFIRRLQVMCNRFAHVDVESVTLLELLL